MNLLFALQLQLLSELLLKKIINQYILTNQNGEFVCASVKGRYEAHGEKSCFSVWVRFVVRVNLRGVPLHRSVYCQCV